MRYSTGDTACHHCRERFVGCHSKCKKYQADVERDKLRLEEEHKTSVLNGYICDACRNCTGRMPIAFRK